MVFVHGGNMENVLHMENLNFDDLAIFHWGFGPEWVLETKKGIWIWSDPEYDGDNTIKYWPGTYCEFLKHRSIGYCRSKGRHIVSKICNGAEIGGEYGR